MALLRFFETGPWGASFEQLTAPAVTPRCLFVHQTGKSEIIAIAELPACPSGCKRIVAVSDTHGKHRLLRLPAGDMLVHAGDLLSRNACVLGNNSKNHHRGRRYLRDFNDWLGELPHGSKVVVGGNHDATLEQVGDEQAQKLLSNCFYLRDSHATVDGLRVYGSPWSRGKSSNRAFQSEAPTLPSVDDQPADVLVSHCFHSELVAAVRPTLYVSGHAHGSFGVITPAEAFGGIAINASSCDTVYRAANLPVVYDITPKVSTQDLK